MIWSITILTHNSQLHLFWTPREVVFAIYRLCQLEKGNSLLCNVKVNYRPVRAPRPFAPSFIGYFYHGGASYMSIQFRGSGPKQKPAIESVRANGYLSPSRARPRSRARTHQSSQYTRSVQKLTNRFRFYSLNWTHTTPKSGQGVAR